MTLLVPSAAMQDRCRFLRLQDVMFSARVVTVTCVLPVIIIAEAEADIADKPKQNCRLNPAILFWLSFDFGVWIYLGFGALYFEFNGVNIGTDIVL